MTRDHWQAHARHWHRLASPLRPAPEDIAYAQRAIRDWRARDGGTETRVDGIEALLLGVTPEIAGMVWPARTRLTAVDRSMAMIKSVWPGAPAGPHVCAALRANWAALPLRPACQHIVIGDGCFVLLEAHEFPALLAGLRDVLREEGLFLIRVFVRPDAPESVADVIGDLNAARIGSFHAFKWRLAMALQKSFAQGVRLSDVWEAWRDAVPEPAALAAARGWPLETVRTIDNYRDASARYAFPTLAEARAAFAPWFEERACFVPRYELGVRCPTFVLKPRPRHAANGGVA